MSRKFIYIILVFIFVSCSGEKYVNTLSTTDEIVEAKKLNLVYTKKLFFVDLILNNKKSRFLVDTGASISILDVTQAKKYGFNYYIANDNVVGIGGSSTRYKINNAKLKTIDDKEVYVKFSGGDLSKVTDAMSRDGLEVVGIIGSDFLMNTKANISYSKKTIDLYAE